MNGAFFELPGALLNVFLRRLLPVLSEIEKENLLLRYQIKILQRQCKRPSFTPADRSILTAISQTMAHWQKSCLILKPETLLKWHRTLSRWKWTTDLRGRRPIDKDLRDLIIRMKQENRLWGPKRIHGELIKLGVTVSETTVRNVLRRARIDPWSGGRSETWREFLTRHKNVWAIDYFTVHSATLRRMFVLVIMEVSSRKLIATHVTSNPSALWARDTLKREISSSPDRPVAILHDRDPSFESAKFRILLKDNGIDNRRTPRRTPIANAFVERLNGTLRRECTDHFIFLGERHLDRTLREYKDYYNYSRPHQSLNQTPPQLYGREKTQRASILKPKSRPVLGGLHHEYRERAA